MKWGEVIFTYSILFGILALAALFLFGCSMTNLAEVIQAASTDQATVCARVTSVYGTLTYLRTNIQGGDVGCDALTVKSTPPGVTIPINVRPTFQMGVPEATIPLNQPGGPPIVPKAPMPYQAPRQ